MIETDHNEMRWDAEQHLKLYSLGTEQKYSTDTKRFQTENKIGQTKTWFLIIR